MSLWGKIQQAEQVELQSVTIIPGPCPERVPMVNWLQPILDKYSSTIELSTCILRKEHPKSTTKPLTTYHTSGTLVALQNPTQMQCTWEDSDQTKQASLVECKDASVSSVWRLPCSQSVIHKCDKLIQVCWLRKIWELTRCGAAWTQPVHLTIFPWTSVRSSGR